MTRYPDVADLFLAADALVTDYSSVMFDFVLTDRPVVLLVPDLDQYRDVERGFYFDIESRSPGPAGRDHRRGRRRAARARRARAGAVGVPRRSSARSTTERVSARRGRPARALVT